MSISQKKNQNAKMRSNPPCLIPSTEAVLVGKSDGVEDAAVGNVPAAAEVVNGGAAALRPVAVELAQPVEPRLVVVGGFKILGFVEIVGIGKLKLFLEHFALGLADAHGGFRVDTTTIHAAEPATTAETTSTNTTTANDVITSWDATGHHDHGRTAAAADTAHAASTHGIGDARLLLDVDRLAHAGLRVGHHRGGRRGNLNGDAVCL